MDKNLSSVLHLNVDQLAAIIKNRIDKVLIIDSRSFLEFNTCHILISVNVCCSKIVKRRLEQDKMSVKDFLVNSCQIEADDSYDVIVYDQASANARTLSPDTFLYVLLLKLGNVFKSVSLLQGGFLEFQASYPSLCEDKTRKFAPMTSLSQPCLSISNLGPTRILPFLYLGSQNDAMNKELLLDHNITYELNVSSNCPKPDFIQDHQFMRISVNDNYSEKLLPHFPKAFNFLDKVQEANGCVLVHCLAGISRSPTVAIAYVMRHLHMTSDEAYRYVKSKRATISPNFNFLGQLLEYEKQLQSENVLRNSSEFSTAPPFINGHKRQCCTDMRSTRKLTLNLPVTTLGSGVSSMDTSVFLSRAGDQSPTTGLANLSFDCPETDKEDQKDALSNRCVTVEKGNVKKFTATCGIQEQKCLSQARCLKTQFTYMTSLREESGSARITHASESTTSTYVIDKTSFADQNLQETSSGMQSLRSDAKTSFKGSPASYLTKLSFTPCHAPSSVSQCASQEPSPEKEFTDPLQSSLSPRSCEKRPFLDSLSNTGNLFDGTDSLASSRYTCSSMSSSWNMLLDDDNRREYCRSDSNSTSGIGSEICCDLSELDVVNPGDTESPVLASNLKNEMIIDNECVILRKPASLEQSPVRNLVEKCPSLKCIQASLKSKRLRDSGNPLSPIENFPAGESESDQKPFSDCWDSNGCSSNSKGSHDSGIVSSPTWNPNAIGFSSTKWSREDFFTGKKSEIFSQEEKKPDKNIDVSLPSYVKKRFADATSLTFSKMSTSLVSKKSEMGKISLIGGTVTDERHQKSEARVFGEIRQSVFAKVSETSGAKVVGKTDDGLYRAQSCPGIVGRLQCTTPSPESMTSSGATFLNSDLRLRSNLNFASVSRAEKFRNRYSVGSLDYGELNRFFVDSCPDFGYFGRCQSSGALTSIADRTPLAPPHRTFNRNLSILQAVS